NVETVADGQRRHVDLDVAGDRRRIDAKMHLVHRLFENTAGIADAVRSADEAERYADGDLFTGDELLEIDVNDAAVHWVTLNLANERLRDGAVDGQLDDGTARRELSKKLLHLAGVDGEGLRLAPMAIDDRGYLARLTKLARDA